MDYQISNQFNQSNLQQSQTININLKIKKNFFIFTKKNYFNFINCFVNFLFKKIKKLQ